MNKKILMIFFLMFLCFPMVTKALATNADYNTVNLYYFCEKENSGCDSGKEWLENELKTNIQINVNVKNIEEEQELYDKVKESLKIKSKKLPFIVIGTNSFTGLSKTNKEHLKEAIVAYQNAEEVCDLVSTIKNERDIKACLNQNKGIYRKSNYWYLYSTFGIVIIGIMAIILKKELNK